MSGSRQFPAMPLDHEAVEAEPQTQRRLIPANREPDPLDEGISALMDAEFDYDAEAGLARFQQRLREEDPSTEGEAETA